MNGALVFKHKHVPLRKVAVHHPEHTISDEIDLDVDWRMTWSVSLIGPVVGGAGSQFSLVLASTEFVCKFSISDNLSVSQQPTQL